MDAMFISTTSSANDDDDVDDVAVLVGSKRHVDAMLFFPGNSETWTVDDNSEI